jgi:3-dehydroquinate synthase
MAYSATLAKQRGLLSEEDHRRLLNLFSRAGLTIDHPLFDKEVLDKGTEAILKTRDGKLRLAVPNPLGYCTFINDVSATQLNDALSLHKSICKTYPREGAGLEAYVDSSDTGYTDNETEMTSVKEAIEEAEIVPIEGGPANGAVNSTAPKGLALHQSKGKINGMGHTNGNGNGNGHVSINAHANGNGSLMNKAKDVLLPSTKVQA